jgi:hypothetical protein
VSEASASDVDQRHRVRPRVLADLALPRCRQRLPSTGQLGCRVRRIRNRLAGGQSGRSQGPHTFAELDIRPGDIMVLQAARDRADLTKDVQ